MRLVCIVASIFFVSISQLNQCFDYDFLPGATSICKIEQKKIDLIVDTIKSLPLDMPENFDLKLDSKIKKENETFMANIRGYRQNDDVTKIIRILFKNKYITCWTCSYPEYSAWPDAGSIVIPEDVAERIIKTNSLSDKDEWLISHEFRHIFQRVALLNKKLPCHYGNHNSVDRAMEDDADYYASHKNVNGGIEHFKDEILKHPLSAFRESNQYPSNKERLERCYKQKEDNQKSSKEEQETFWEIYENHLLNSWNISRKELVNYVSNPT